MSKIMCKAIHFIGKALIVIGGSMVTMIIGDSIIDFAGCKWDSTWNDKINK